MKIKFIIFDAYGVTLSGGYGATMKYLARRFGRDWKKLYDVYYIKYFNLAAERKITQSEAWREPTEELKIPMPWQEIRKVHYKLMGLNHLVVKFAKKIRKKTPTLLLSKNTRSQFVDIKKMFPLKKIFDYVLNTYELNFPKASRKTYHYLMKKFKIRNPKEIIYIDDQKENLNEAKKLGIRTIFYKNFGQMKKEAKKYLGN